MRYGAGSLHNSPSAAEWSGGWWCDVKCADLFVLSFRETIVAVEGADGAWPAPSPSHPAIVCFWMFCGRLSLSLALSLSRSLALARPCCIHRSHHPTYTSATYASLPPPENDNIIH